jgi:hypothetical protein
MRLEKLLVRFAAAPAPVKAARMARFWYKGHSNKQPRVQRAIRKLMS